MKTTQGASVGTPDRHRSRRSYLFLHSESQRPGPRGVHHEQPWQREHRCANDSSAGIGCATFNDQTLNGKLPKLLDFGDECHMDTICLKEAKLTAASLASMRTSTNKVAIRCLAPLLTFTDLCY